MGCFVCNNVIVTKAHVKDHVVCISEGVSDHEYLNIVDLCYNCHYNFFDRGKMGILKQNSLYFFVMLNDKNEIEIIESKHKINVLEENIRWKNLKCKPRLWKTLFLP
ncbi:MAG: hypothetical protein RL259_951 [Bacteroidota bacterium]|jgi:hypothetical protein